MLASDEATHGPGEHVAAVSVPRLHEDVPDTVYPELHVGWHVEPLARELVQSPTPPFVGGADAEQGFAEQVAAVRQRERQAMSRTLDTLRRGIVEIDLRFVCLT